MTGPDRAGRTPQPAGEPVAEVTDLTIGRATGGPALIDSVGFTIARGELLGVAGRSGSGKTTAALALLGHLRPGLVLRRGSVRVRGIDPFTPRGARQLRGRVVSFLGQDPVSALNPYRRLGAQLAEAVLLRTRSAQRAAAPRDRVRAEVVRLLASVALPGERAFLRRYPHQVSGGQAQRVAFAIAMAGEPDLLVLDEPTGGLDALLARELADLVARLTQHCGTLLVSHDAHLLATLANRVMVLHGGRVVAHDTPGQVLAAALAPVTPPASPTEPPAPGGLRIELLRARHGRRRVVDGITLAVPPGRCLALVGPSGSGKSTLARCVVGLHRPESGTLTLNGQLLAGQAAARTREQRRAVQLVAQDSVGALNPRETVRAALARPMQVLRGLPPEQVAREIARLLDRVRLPVEFVDRRPGSLSGGERQRVNLARALAAEPTLLICDEVTSALDPEVGHAVLDLVDELRRTLGLAILLVTHDLSVVARCAAEVAVLDGGQVVEQGETATVLGAPQHPVTAALVNSVPALHPAPATEEVFQ